MAKSILLLGTGFVARPTAQILSDSGHKVVVASRNLEAAKKLADGLKNAVPISLDANDDAALDKEVEKADVVISLIPYTLHVNVIKSAIRKKKDVVTTSYISPAIAALDQEAKDAGITIMNEIGLDPGIDHLYAVKTISEVHKAGGKIKGFISYCGGLPAPENSDNPLGYKFSWSARGALLALRNDAKFYKGGKEVKVAGTELMGTAKPYHIFPGFALVAYPNRDSTPYKERYNIPEAESIIRGTLRFQGFCEMVRTLVDIGFLSDKELDILNPKDKSPSWRDVTQKVLGASSNKEEDLVWAISSKTSFADTNEKERIIAGLRWIGLFSDETVSPRGNALDTLCATLEKKMAYGPGERDLVILQHRFDIEKQDGSKEVRTSTLVDYGAPEGSGAYSSMAKLVGTPCAVAVQQVLDGKIKHGVQAPMDPEINDPIMKELKEKYGIEMKEAVVA